KYSYKFTLVTLNLESIVKGFIILWKDVGEDCTSSHVLKWFNFKCGHLSTERSSASHHFANDHLEGWTIKIH
ncbi:hypothetical protein L9F63_012571, partial [Diploptera punctata]